MWYQSLKWCVPILDVDIVLVASNFECAGMNCFSKAILQSAQLLKSTGVKARATFCLSRAHLPAGVLSLKYVKAEETFLPSLVRSQH